MYRYLINKIIVASIITSITKAVQSNILYIPSFHMNKENKIPNMYDTIATNSSTISNLSKSSKMLS